MELRSIKDYPEGLFSYKRKIIHRLSYYGGSLPAVSAVVKFLNKGFELMILLGNETVNMFVFALFFFSKYFHSSSWIHLYIFIGRFSLSLMRFILKSRQIYRLHFVNGYALLSNFESKFFIDRDTANRWSGNKKIEKKNLMIQL